MPDGFFHRSRSCWGVVGALGAGLAAAEARADGFTLPMMSMSLAAAEEGDATGGHRSTPAAGDGEIETGVDPSKLLFRFECNPQYIDFAGDGSLLTTNIKFDIPITKSIGVAIDAPIGYASGFPAPIDDSFGLGDIAVRVRHVWSFEKMSLIAGAEAVMQSATEDIFGGGKWQLNPSVAFVYHFSHEYLLATAWKQRISIAGDDDRPDLNASEFRLIGIYINPEGWWLQADYQPKIDWEGGGEASHLMEFEAGAMITRSVGVSIRPGFGFGENKERDWSIGLGLRFLF